MTDIDELGKAVMRDFGDFIFSRSKDNIVSMWISDTGALLISGGIKEIAGKVVIEYTAPYAQGVNDGTEKHFVDPKNLLAWVDKKLGVPSKDVEKVARRIANKIAKFGTKPQPFLDNAIMVAREKYKGVVDLT